MARLEGIPAKSGGKQVSYPKLDQLPEVLLPEGYKTLTLFVTDGESISDFVTILGYVYPGRALEMAQDAQSVTMLPETEVKPKKGKNSDG